jgi:prevent-host-death family protein
MVTSGNVMTMKGRDRVVPAGEFKAKCLAIFDEVEMRRRSFVVTKRGRPVARIVPLSSEAPQSLRGSLLHEEDLLAPVDAEWDAQS